MAQEQLSVPCGRQRTIRRFVITFEVEPDHPAYDDPEWAADAAHGALANEHGLRAIYTDITEVIAQG